MGTPPFAVPSVRALYDRGHEIAAVFTQPDRPAGRGQAPRGSAVKRFALEKQISVEQPEKLRDPAVIARMRELAPMVRKDEGTIDWSRSAAEIERAVRAFTPWPSAYTTLHGKLLKVHRAAVASRPAPAPAGTVVRATGGDLEVATGEGRQLWVDVAPGGRG